MGKVAERRRKHWGWGFEDQALDRAQLEAAAPGIRERLGLGGERVEEPVAIDEVELPPPRVEPPPSLSHLFSSAPYERLAHALGKAYRDVVRGFRGQFDNPPDLEDQLRDRGLTLRHFPQSFELSTLGGWIATRAGGHFATLYTHIDDLVESVRALTPRGWWESRRLPGSGAGPSPDRLLVGSEGTLGVITEAWLRVQARPRWRASATVVFASWGSAVD